MLRIGGWLFRRRTIVPLPVALVVLLTQESLALGSTRVVVAGVAAVVIGEGIRLWGVRRIGAISRTRGDRLGPLVASGPFAIIRNPLYVGNILLWAGFSMSARLLWFAPVCVAILAFEYQVIVRWEERLLEERLGERYQTYARQVPRWIPTSNRGEPRGSQVSTNSAISAVNVFSWRDTLHSERGTLIAIAVGYLLLWIKAHA